MSTLAARHDVAALYLRRRGELPIGERLAAQCAWVREIPAADGRAFPSRVRRRLAPYVGRPTWVADTWAPAMARDALQTALSWKPHVLHFEYHVMAQYAHTLRALPAARVLTEYEPGVVAREHLSRGKGLGRLRAFFEYRAWNRFERDVIARMAAVVVFTERDRAMVAGLGISTPVFCIPARIAAAPCHEPAIAAQSQTVLFVGNFNHPPNVDAAARLIHVLHPAVRASIPAALLQIVGVDPPADMRSSRAAGIEVTGRVNDPSSYLAKAAVVAVPLRQGGGMRVKVIEALAAGKAVVASRLAVEGLGVQHGVDIWLADSDDEFVSAISTLLRCPGQRNSLGVAASAWASRFQSPGLWLAQYDAMYARLGVA